MTVVKGIGRMAYGVLCSIGAFIALLTQPRWKD